MSYGEHFLSIVQLCAQRLELVLIYIVEAGIIRLQVNNLRFKPKCLGGWKVLRLDAVVGQ
jgi:hypothetical protein